MVEFVSQFLIQLLEILSLTSLSTFSLGQIVNNSEAIKISPNPLTVKLAVLIFREKF